ncbi:hypothetical protein Acr_17g0011410 [Actinidia rufa]|uniref:Uncharacterized protein n=1 Tax=Actinidia rufa TaxID=165716 RepID=A0A7J0G469_9ERIC|nr:hypothetical protein Acr_17g0011410 [Actinidia rufa]
MKASEGSQKGKVIESLTKTNEDLEKQLKAAEGFNEAAEAEKSTMLNEVDELKKKNEDLISEAQAFEAVKASLVSRVAKLDEQLKVAAKALFPDLDFSALKPAEDTLFPKLLAEEIKTQLSKRTTLSTK